MGRKGSGMGVQWDLSRRGRGHNGTERVRDVNTVGFEHKGSGAQWDGKVRGWEYNGI